MLARGLMPAARRMQDVIRKYYTGTVVPRIMSSSHSPSSSDTVVQARMLYTRAPEVSYRHIFWECWLEQKDGKILKKSHVVVQYDLSEESVSVWGNPFVPSKIVLKRIGGLKDS